MPKVLPVEFSSFHDYFEGFCPHLLVYGFNGTGKTTFAAKTGIPEDGFISQMKTVLLDCGDAGVVTLRKIPRNIKIIRIKNTAHYLDAMDKINRIADMIDLLVVDTLTGLQSKAIREVKGRGEMNQRKWGQAGGKVIECISETKNFPKDVIYLAQERRKTKTVDEVEFTHHSPSLTPAIREALGGAVDWTGRLYMEDGKRKLSFILTDEVEAKDRADLFPKVIVNPSYPPIRKRIVETIHG